MELTDYLSQNRPVEYRRRICRDPFDPGAGRRKKQLDQRKGVCGHYYHFPDDTGAVGGKYLTFVGLQIGGVAGALTATIGCVFCGITISLILYYFIQKYQKSVYVLEILNGLKYASLGLIISAAVTIVSLALFGSSKAKPDLLSLNWAAFFLFLVMLFFLRKWKPNPIIILLISGIAGLAFYG